MSDRLATSAEIKEAEALVHLIRDLSADVDETVQAVKSAPPQVRKIAHALMQQPKGES